MERCTASCVMSRSPSTRRAWIEILDAFYCGTPHTGVALHPEGVDRNMKFAEANVEHVAVALHPEGVDRNRREQAAADVAA